MYKVTRAKSILIISPLKIIPLFGSKEAMVCRAGIYLPVSQQWLIALGVTITAKVWTLLHETIYYCILKTFLRVGCSIYVHIFFAQSKKFIFILLISGEAVLLILDETSSFLSAHPNNKASCIVVSSQSATIITLEREHRRTSEDNANTTRSLSTEVH